MKKTIIKNHWKNVVIIVGVLQCGCTNPKLLYMDMAKIANAELAINKAQDSNAEELAPRELHDAIRKLRQAKKAISEKYYDEAVHLAEKALMDAMLAEAKAELEMAQQIAKDWREKMKKK
ncbi:DUF4398 domain-containing protein [Candidatus Parabeggiatoa sp. HSG14]|uniref:DUF4398 domain-containing protein n=1 Tax=Candidatus Parabeggiatoa sp. HSG14 TaxID=3055593 RepID=UPI0025A86FC7|nr:DUF4398 domain-containing protein [Thiotrichales bacterium HSG14]